MLGWRFQSQVWEFYIIDYPKFTRISPFLSAVFKVTTYSSRYNRNEYVQNYTQYKSEFYTHMSYIFTYHHIYNYLFIYVAIYTAPFKRKNHNLLKEKLGNTSRFINPALDPRYAVWQWMLKMSRPGIEQVMDWRAWRMNHWYIMIYVFLLRVIFILTLLIYIDMYILNMWYVECIYEV